MYSLPDSWPNSTKYLIQIPSSLPSHFGAEFHSKEEISFSTATNQVHATLTTTQLGSLPVGAPLAVAFTQKIVGLEQQTLNLIRYAVAIDLSIYRKRFRAHLYTSYSLSTSKIIKVNYSTLSLLSKADIARWRKKWSVLDVFLQTNGEDYCVVFSSDKRLPYKSTVDMTIGPKVRKLKLR